MSTFTTLQQVLDARREAANGVHYIVSDTRERRIGYRELHARALGMLKHLQDQGARPGSEMILLIDALEPFVDAFWACVMGRIIAVPLAPGNTDEHKRKFFHVLERLADPHVATERKAFERLASFARENGLEAELERLAGRAVFVDEIADLGPPGVRQAAGPDDIAFVQFSSGSTSAPKGIVLTHRNLLTNIEAILAGIGGAAADDTSLSWMPLTHDMGLIGFHLTPLVAGASHWLMPTALFVRRPALWMMKASEHRVTVTCSPNFGYKHYLKSFDADKRVGLDLSRLRVIFNGAEPIAADLCREFLAVLGPAGLAQDVMFPVYGLAEASLAVTFPPLRRPLATVALSRGALGLGDVARHVAPDAADAVIFVRVGTPVDGCAIRISGSDDSALPDGQVGRIMIRGANVTAGYYRDPELTASVVSADGWLDTGDLGALVDGELAVTGRSKDILFVAGQNHYPHDIEEVLARHAGIELGRAAAAGVRAAEAATDDVIVFVLQKGGTLADFAPVARTVRRVVNERMGLNVVAVVPLRQLPKTTSGKVQRYALAREYEHGSYAGVLAELAALDALVGDAQAASAVERELLEICQHLMPDKVLKPEDNLFELGTSSLTLAQIYERVEAAYPGRLEVTDFFDYPTVREMAAFLGEKLTAEA
jgi:acyl-CoA synthetase (AMP-forming)/AMP-acid ligase II